MRIYNAGTSQHVLSGASRKGSKLWWPSLGTRVLWPWSQHRPSLASPFPFSGLSLPTGTVRGCVAEVTTEVPDHLTASTRLLWHQDGPIHSHVGQSPRHALMSLPCPQFVQELGPLPTYRHKPLLPQGSQMDQLLGGALSHLP